MRETNPLSLLSLIAALALTALACDTGLSPEQHDWRIINELGLDYATVEDLDTLEYGMSYGEVAESMPTGGTELTSPDHLPVRGIGNMRRYFQSAIEQPRSALYAWQNHDNEIMLVAFNKNALVATWDGEYVTLFTKS
jgi:hypothetical protein